ncbi:MAG: hypothetical protein IPN23_07800 [Elusimicrobia bacterium]|nr:hypothetical protein [Elusimicrobiota bacterium]
MASSVTVAGFLNVTGSTVLGNFTAASGTITNLTVGSATIAGSATAGSITTANLTVTNTITAPILAAPYPMMIVADVKPSGTEGGQFASGAWRVRTLNTVSFNSISGASLSADTVTLPAGTYKISWRAPAFRVYRHQTVWRNITDSVDAIIGSSAYADNVNNGGDNSEGVGIFNIPSTKSFPIVAPKSSPLQY